MNSTYSKKLKDPKWRDLRTKIFERDGYKCRHCQKFSTKLHAHHTCYEGYDRDPLDYEEYTIITLCVNCHSNEHALDKIANHRLMCSINRTGISNVDKASLTTLFEVIPRGLPDDFWDVMMVSFTDPSFYNKAKKIYYSKRNELSQIVKSLRDDIQELNDEYSSRKF